MTVTPLQAHSVVEYPKGSPQYVWSACGSQIVAWACVSCGGECPTRAHLVEHCKQDADHIVGRLCHHGLEAPEIKAKGEQAA